MNALRRFDLGRGGGHGGFGGGRGFGGGFGSHQGYESTWGVFTNQAPFESGTCKPGEVVGPDGVCHPKASMGQTAPAASPAAPGTPRGTGGMSTHRTIGLAAAVIGLGAGATQVLAKNPKLNKVAFWTEMAALAVLAGVVVGIPGMGGKPAPAPTTSGS